MKLVVRDSNFSLNVLSVVPSITIAPVLNSTVSTSDGIFNICEVAFDYVRNEVTVYAADGYDLRAGCEEYDQEGNIACN